MNQIVQFVEQYGTWAMLAAIFLEYACFPVSSEIILPLSGAVASRSRIPFLLITPASVVAGLLGTSFCYWLGRIGGEALLNWLMRKFPKSEKGIRKSCAYFEKKGAVTVGTLRVVPLCRTYIAFVAGAFSMPYSSFFGASLLGITVWNSLLIASGYVLGEHWEQVQTWYRSYAHLLLPLVLLLLLALFGAQYLWKRFRVSR